jgi:hypothetical protein
MKTYYKLAKPDGWDFYSGKTINYRKNIGKTVKPPLLKEWTGQKPDLCTTLVLHACPKPLDCFVGARIPCSVYLVTGRSVVDDGSKYGFRSLKVLEEIPQEKLDGLFGFKYAEAVNTINPFKIKPPMITDEHIKLLQSWDSVRDSVRDSIVASVRDSVGASAWASAWDSAWASAWASTWASVRASIGASVRASAWASAWDSAWDSAWASVRASVGASVGASAWDSVYAYVGSLFPSIKEWKYCEKVKAEGYPFQPVVDLWKQGLATSFYCKTWHLHGGEKTDELYTISETKLKTWKAANK